MDDASEGDMGDEQRAIAESTGELPEGWHYRSNGAPSNQRLKSHIAQEDLNGSRLEPLTDSLALDLHLAIFVAVDSTCEYCGIDDDDPRAAMACTSTGNPNTSAFHKFGGN